MVPSNIDQFYFDVNYGMNDSVFTLVDIEAIAPIPPIVNSFLLLDNTNFLLLDGTNLVLL